MVTKKETIENFARGGTTGFGRFRRRPFRTKRRTGGGRGEEPVDSARAWGETGQAERKIPLGDKQMERSWREGAEQRRRSSAGKRHCRVTDARS
jgi:hypothetical protein